MEALSSSTTHIYVSQSLLLTVLTIFKELSLVLKENAIRLRLDTKIL